MNTSNGTGRTRAQINAANRYASYVRGWTDGAKASSRRAEFDSHADDELRAAYSLGYVAGMGAREDADRDARCRYDHEPTILRVRR